MQLSEVESLTADYSQNDVNELADVTRSTRLSSSSAVLRWGKIAPLDLEEWMRKLCAAGLKREFQVGRISSVQCWDELPQIPLAEHILIRDLDLTRGSDGSGAKHDMSLLLGRIVAHANYCYTPSYGTPAEDTSVVTDADQPCAPSIVTPPGFNGALSRYIGKAVDETMTKLFGGLPCFELHVISTLTPSHLRKGIAKRLTEWIFPYADRVALPVILSASPVGFFLYKQCGFVEYQSYNIVIELEPWGGEGSQQIVAMVRWPTRIEALPEVWREWRKVHDFT